LVACSKVRMIVATFVAASISGAVKMRNQQALTQHS